MKEKSRGEKTAGIDPATSEVFPVSFSIFSLARSHQALAGALLRKLNLYTGQEIVLMRLWDQDGISQKAIQETLQVDHSTVAKSIKRMEAAGLVTTVKSEQDRRVTLVYLSDRGKALHQSTLEAWAELERRTVRGLTIEEQTAFIALARKLEPMVRAEIDSK